VALPELQAKGAVGARRVDVMSGYRCCAGTHVHRVPCGPDWQSRCVSGGHESWHAVQKNIATISQRTMGEAYHRPMAFRSDLA
jgi:hypothetical protein